MSLKNILNKRFPKKTSLLTLAFFVVLILALYFIFFSTSFTKISDVTHNIINHSACRFVRRLDGVCLNQKSEKNLWPVAVMFDNHPNSWPQYGLNSAQIVYSTLVEGGATRMMAVYATADKINRLGPVRSARPYFLTWVKELNALYMHVGGSAAALQEIKDLDILDCNEMTSYGPEYFFRNWSKASPHNVFTSSQNISQARQDWEVASSTSNFMSWQFTDQISQPANPVEKISLKYSQIYPYDIKYEYSTSTQKFLRFQNRQPQIDALDDSQIAVTNLIFQYVPQQKVLDSIGRLEINTLGTGKAEYFIAGKKYSGAWQKKDLSSRTIFYDQQGNQMQFLPGNIWIEIIPGEKEVTYE